MNDLWWMTEQMNAWILLYIRMYVYMFVCFFLYISCCDGNWLFVVNFCFLAHAGKFAETNNVEDINTKNEKKKEMNKAWTDDDDVVVDDAVDASIY